MSREAFEAWAKDRPREFDLDIQTDMGAWPGQYDDYITQCAWEGWQAAEKATAARCAEIVEGQGAIGGHRESLAKAIRAEYSEDK